MPAHGARARIDGEGGSRERPEPTPLLRRCWRPSLECVGQLHARLLFGAVGEVDRANRFEVRAPRVSVQGGVRRQWAEARPSSSDRPYEISHTL